MKEKKSLERMCIACRGMFPKRELIRIVRTADNELVIDKTGKTAGRGTYICNKRECVARCVRGKLLNKAFKSEISTELYTALSDEYGAKKD